MVVKTVPANRNTWFTFTVLIYQLGIADEGAVEQIVGRERRERVSQLAWCGGGCFDSRRRVNSTVRCFAHMKVTTFHFSFALLLALAICAPAVAQSSSLPEKQTLRGRVLAEVARPYGAGLGPLWQFFIF